MRVVTTAEVVFCDECGSLLKPPLYWCCMCGRALPLTGGVLLKQLEKILKDERAAELEGEG